MRCRPSRRDPVPFLEFFENAPHAVDINAAFQRRGKRGLEPAQ